MVLSSVFTFFRDKSKVNGVAVLNPILFNIVYAFLWLYCRTWRYEYNDLGGFDKGRAEGKYYVLPIWHNQLLALTFRWRGEGTKASAASQSKDGALITMVMERWKLKMARGSSSKGGVRALIGLKKVMDEYKVDGALTVDGPRGPRYEVKPGAVYLAKITNCDILPIYCDCTWFKQFNSWDKFVLPLPFAKIKIYTMEPIKVSPDTSDVVVKQETEMLNKLMNEQRRVYSPNFL